MLLIDVSISAPFCSMFVWIWEKHIPVNICDLYVFQFIMPGYTASHCVCAEPGGCRGIVQSEQPSHGITGDRLLS